LPERAGQRTATQCLVSGSMTNTCPSSSSRASMDGSRSMRYHYHTLIRKPLKRQASLVETLWRSRNDATSQASTQRVPAAPSAPSLLKIRS
jgi:hypothetical protein